MLAGHNPSLGRRLSIPGVLLLSLCAGAAGAHLGTPYQRAAGVLDHDGPIALVVVKTNTDASGLEARTQVDVAATLEGELPETLEMVDGAPHVHRLRQGELVLVALTRSPAGRWLYAVDTARPLVVPAGEQRATRAFVRIWRARRGTDPTSRLQEWVGLTRHSSTLARKVALESLVAHAADLSERVGESQLESLGDVLEMQALPVGHRVATLRTMELLAARRAAPEVARRFERLGPSTLSHAAVGLFGRHPTSEARRALQRCGETGAPAVATRCRRVLDRISKGIPAP
jgi:hypothetical protein